MSRPCSVDGCDGLAGVPGTARGYCSRHYARFMRTGDPLVMLSDLKPKQPDECSVDGCDFPRWARGWCTTHYQRWRATGDVGGPERKTAPAVGTCSVGGCRRPVKTKSLCSRHYQRKLRHGHPEGGGPYVGQHGTCLALGCDREHYAKGLCHGHWSAVGRIRQREDRIGVSVPGRMTAEQMVARVSYYANRCWMCGGAADQIDHVKPLSKGGSHWPANIRPACAECNAHKSQRWPLEETA